MKSKKHVFLFLFLELCVFGMRKNMQLDKINKFKAKNFYEQNKQVFVLTT